MTDEGLGYKLRVVKQAKFEYSPLRKVFDKGSEEDEKKEELLNRLKNIEDKNEEKPKAIKKGKQNKICVLKLEMIKFFEIYPGSFLKNSRSVLKNLVKN